MSADFVPERTFARERRIYLGDATVSGRLRFDAIASYLQDIAADDSHDAGFELGVGWILRRLELDVERLPRVYADLSLVTSCTGTGRRWAERTTTLTDVRRGGGAGVTARGLWVCVDAMTGASQPLPPEFFTVYGEAVRHRTVRAKLTIPAPPPGLPSSPWPLRLTDFDVFGHVNNAIYWSPVEERLPGWLQGRKVTSAVIEFGGGIDPGDEPRIVESIDADDDLLALWFVVGDEVRASVQVHAS